MKQSAARTLGVAVLGAVFAAAAAGTASAAALPADAPLPVHVAFPASNTLGAMAKAVPDVTHATANYLQQENAGGDAGAPVTGLFGGMPAV